MIRAFLVLLFLVVATGCDRSSDAPPVPVTTTATVVEELPPPPEPELVVDKLLIWEVSPRANSTAKSYLVGTYHVGTDFHGLSELPEAGYKAFESSKRIVLEADLGLVDPEVDKLALLDGPRTLDAMLSPEQWEAALQHTGLPPQRLKRLRAYAVTGELTKKWTPGAGVRGMDGRFRILAKAYEKKLAYLETPREQVEMVSAAVTVEMLGEMLDHAEEEKARTQELLTTFKTGDTAALEAELFPPEQVEAHRDFYDKVFWKRNEAWVERLEPFLEEGGAFIAVGAGHLLGDPNLRDLLENAGYSVVVASP